MEPEPDYKLEFEFFKHLTTLASGGLLIYATLTEKVRPFSLLQDFQHFLVMVVLGISVWMSVTCMRKIAFTTADEKPLSAGYKKVTARVFTFTFVLIGAFFLFPEQFRFPEDADSNRPAEAAQEPTAK